MSLLLWVPFSSRFSLCWMNDANRKEDSLYCDGISRNSYGVLYSVGHLKGSFGRPLSLTIDSGLLANLSAMFLTSSIGRWADKHPSRLQTLRLTICVQWVTICLACFGWSFVLSTSPEDKHHLSSHVNWVWNTDPTLLRY
jgi:hypothetical protein